MAAISVGSVEVDVVPNTRGIYQHLRTALVPAATRAGEDAGSAAGRAFGPAMQSQIGGIGLRIGEQIGRQIAARLTTAVRDGLRDGVTQGGRAARPAATRQGEETGGAFARSLRARLQAAFRSMPHLDVRLSDTGVDADLARLRARLESLAGKTVGIDIDAATARAQAADIEERLRRIGAAHPNVAVRADTAAAIAQLQLLQQQIDDVSRDPARIRVETDGTFGQRLRAQVQAAEASLPNINLTADSSAAEVEIARLRAQLTALRDVRIGVDMDTATATARITALQTRLQALSSSDADVAVRVDASAAAAQLAAVQAMVNRLDGQTANVTVRMSGIQVLLSAALALGPALLPVLPVAAAGLGAVAAAAVAAGAGIGGIALVAVPAFKQIGTVLQAQKAAQDAAANATMRGGQAAAQAASRANQMASAQQNLATAHRNAARQIRQAERGIQDAVRNASEANRRAKQQLADAVQQAADRQRQSAEQVARAEESLADAQRDAQQAQKDLNQARRDAAQELADLQTRLTNAQLSERDAVLSVQEARDRLRAVQMAGSRASYMEQQRAQLAYDQAVQRLKEQQAETKRLTAEKKTADKAGVDGSRTVLDAQERLRQADKKVAEQQRDLARARSDAARQQVEAQRAVAEAQRNVARTQEDGARSVARAQEQLAEAQASAADSIASAQRQISSAALQAAGGIDQAAIAQAKYREELAKLTPEARETMLAYTGLRDAFSAWSRSLQPEVMPIFTRALNGMKRSLPGLTPFVREAADAVQSLMDRASAELKKPFWQDFKEDLQGAVKPAIEGLGISFGNVFKGMAGIVGAFLPHMDSISERMQRLTGRFADWGASLKDSPEFRDFLSYSSEMAPKLSGALREIASAALKISSAMSPITSIVLGVVEKVAEGIGWLAEKAPWLVRTIYGIALAFTGWRIAMVLWAAAMKGAAIAMRLFTIISAAGPWGWIALAIAAVIGIIVLLWTKCDWFRNAIKGVWEAIRSAAVAVKDWFAGPFKRFFTETIPAVFRSVLDWVKRNWPWILGALTGPIGLAVVWIIKNWDKVRAGLKAGWDWIKRNVLFPVRDFFTKTIPGWARSLAKGVSERWDAMMDGLSRGWGWLKKNVLYPIRDFFTKTIPGWGTSLKNRLVNAFESAADGIGRAFSGIRSAARKPIQYVVDVVYNNGIRGVWNRVAGAFGAPKLSYYKFASGGVMPGYTPGRDVHKFVSPTGGALELSGGEAIMRPEFTRAVGSGFVHSLNALARSRGSQGVKAALAPMLGGNPRTPTDTSLRYARGGVFPTQRFASGGIFGWIKDRASDAVGAGSAAWNKIKEGASWLGDTLESSARAGVKKVVEPLLKRFPGMDTGFGKLIRRIPNKVIDALFGYSKEADKRGGSGIGGPRIQAALRWAKTQHGKPYQWGGNGNPSWDCSGFMSAIESVIRGQKPHRRWATMAFRGKTAPPGWVKNGQSAFKVGITNAGVGHTAGTIGKTNVESRGGDGVVVGSRARGYKSSLFTDWYGFKPGTYDSGGFLQPGLNLAYNGTGRPEPVFTTQQANALTSLAARGGSSGPARFEGDLYLDSGEFLGRVRGEATAVMQEGQRQLIQTLNAG
ncbi:hypothetical protein [Streptomyces albogriseolus]|uniref:hypothetical protein n=1 Tax=Streptomyces albogriseolus TaxID=1887 RepID=UPI00369FA3C9